MPYVAASIRLKRAAALLSATGLVACSTPFSLPPEPAQAPPSSVSPPAAATQGQDTTPAPAPAVAPEAQALQARFPEPAVNFRTPAFQPGRSTFTSGAELQRLLQGLARDHAAVVRTVRLGDSPSGVAYEALVFSRSAQATPESLRASGRATVVLFGPQRADAPAGTEALLVVAQELAQGRWQHLLDKVNVIVWPQAPETAAAVVDATTTGTGPAADHLQLKTPYAQALARLVREYQPAVVAEVAEYLPSATFSLRFGAVERHDAMLQTAATGNMAPFVAKATEEWFRQPLAAQLRQQGLSQEWHYAIANDAVERRLAMGSPRPDSSRNAQGLRHAVSLMIESRGDATGGRLHFKRRVYTLVTALGSVLQSSADRSTDLLKIRQYVEAEVSSQACKGFVVVEAALTPSEHTLQALDAATGAEKSFTVSWESALALREVRSRPRPCGYWLDASQTQALASLRALGVRVEQVMSNGVVQGDTYAEAASPPSGEVKTVSALLDLQPGGYYVPLSQPLAHLAVAALEPDSPYSYWAGGLVTGLDKAARVMSWPGAKLVAVP